MAPLAGILYGSGIAVTKSGMPMFHPSTNFTGAGAVLGSPSTAPVSAHRTSRSISAAVSDGSFEKTPCGASAYHGGILLVRTASRIAFAQGLVPAYVRNDIGPTSPGL